MAGTNDMSDKSLAARGTMTAGASIAPAAETENAKQAGDGQFTQAEEYTITRALGILQERHFGPNRSPLDSPLAVKNYLTLKLTDPERECFCAIWLDAGLRPIAFEEISRGTLFTANVYVREVVKSALRHNAAAVIFAHNHPSGSANPSQADERMTEELRSALNAVDIRLLDHFVIAGGRAISIDEQCARKTAQSAAVAGQAQGSGTLCTTQSEEIRAATSGPSLADDNSYFGDTTKPFEALFRLMAGQKCGDRVRYTEFESERLEAISTHAENVKQEVFCGLQAIGHALAIAANTGDLDKRRISDIGWFISNLGELAEACNHVKSEADFARSCHGAL